jgi:hypothetical protein
MKVVKSVANTHEWHKTAFVQVFLVLVSLFTLVMASGALTCGWN